MPARDGCCSQGMILDEAGSKESLEHLVEVSAVSAVDPAAARAAADAARAELSAHTREIRELVTKLQLGGQDLREGSAGFALWVVLQELQDEVCLQRNSSYMVKFSTGEERGQGGQAARRLLAASGSGSSSSTVRQPLDVIALPSLLGLDACRSKQFPLVRPSSYPSGW